MDATQLTTGAVLQNGKYRIERVLGQGGFGITYLATQDILERKVAIKEFFMRDFCTREGDTSTVSLGSTANRETMERYMAKFLKEARIISELSHPNIIRIYDIFRENNTAYYVMEYIEGQSLSEYVKSRGPLSEKEAIGHIRAVGEALEYIHAKHINHLDVKPGNIMLSHADHHIYLLDFGLSKQYDADGNQTSSTPVGISHGYAPIEQYSPSGVKGFSPQTDIYALGATLYYLLTGIIPPPAGELQDSELAFPNTVSSSMRKAITEALKHRKSQRPQDINAFLRLLEVENEETEFVKPEPPKKEEPIPVRMDDDDHSSKKQKYLLAAILAIFVIGGIVFYLNSRSTSYETISFAPEGMEVCMDSSAVDVVELPTAVEDTTEMAMPEETNVPEKPSSVREEEEMSEEVVEANNGKRENTTPQRVNSTPNRRQNQETNNVSSHAGARQENAAENVHSGSTPEPQEEDPITKVRKAAEAGDANAQYKMGDIYNFYIASSLGREPISEDKVEAAKWYQKAAEQGHMYAQFNLGDLFYSGQGVSQNYSEAAKWYQKAAEQGYLYAQYKLGILFYSGKGVPQNYSEAAKWYRKAAEQGYVYAQKELGLMYWSGEGVPRNLTECAKWLLKAAEQGNMTAQLNLAALYENGWGVPKNIEEALKWYQKAAEQGNSSAQSAVKRLSKVD